jgi:hypothetical protein
MMMKAAIVHLFVALLVVTRPGSAFVTDRLISPSSFGVPRNHPYDGVAAASSTSCASPRLFLHPRQAKDLEACAYDLLREASSSTKTSSSSSSADGGIGTSQGTSSDLKTSDACPSSGGPIAWCRRVVQQQQQGRRTHKATTANTKRP